MENHESAFVENNEDVQGQVAVELPNPGQSNMADDVLLEVQAL
jgi:hypothetical protein